MKHSARWSWLLLAAFLFASSALGTQQVPDYLLIDGERVDLHANPLAGWLTQHPGALPRARFDPSNNWRGYVATWQIDEGKLWLRKVEISVGMREGEWDGVDETWPYLYRDARSEMFPDTHEVLASWFSGILVVPKGKKVKPVHSGYASNYERYTILWLRKGELSRRLDLDAKQNTEFRRDRFEAYKRTEAFRSRMAEMATEGTREENEQYLFDAALMDYLSEDFEDPAH